MQATEVAALLRASREQAGMTQEELARVAGTSQSTLASYETGRREPRLSTLRRILGAAGFDLQLVVHPHVRRGARRAAEVARAIAELLATEGERAAWREVLDFVDDVRGSSNPVKAWLVADPPPLCGDARFDAALAGVIELLCNEAGIAAPSWTTEPARYVEPWWFVAGLPGYEAMALRDSPVELKRHGVFVNAGAFDRV